MRDHQSYCAGEPCTCLVARGDWSTPSDKAYDLTPKAEPTRRIKLSDLMILPNVTAGMNPYVVMSLTHLYRSTTQDVEPIKVEISGGQCDGTYIIHDGRHRFVASMMAGRNDILAEILDI